LVKNYLKKIERNFKLPFSKVQKSSFAGNSYENKRVIDKIQSSERMMQMQKNPNMNMR